MDVLGFVTLVITGFTACAEFGSYAWVHPVVKRLPARHHIEVEQGFLGTFGRVMPILMPACLALAVAHASVGGGEGGPATWRWIAVGLFAGAVATTLAVNVPANLATGKWDPEHPPEDWQEVRNRWEAFQGVRSWLLLLGFVAICVGFATGA
jgi:hypothetical protein